MRLIFLNRFYWPDEPATAQLLTDLAEALAARGVECTVIASQPGDATVPCEEVRYGVRIIRVGSSRSANGGVAAKALDFVTFHLAALWRLLITVRRGDTVAAMTDPPLLGVGVWLVAALRGARLVHWVQDIYPELATELSGNSALSLLRPLRNFAWRRAHGCVTLGSDMADVLARSGVAREKISITPNWAPTGLGPAAPADIAALRAEWGVSDKFVVAYSGNLGRVHDLEPVLELARALREDRRIEFVFVGRGAQRPTLEAAAAQAGLANVRFLPPQPRARLGASLAAGDLHLVTVLPGCERYVFPSKLYGVAAVGRPVLLIGPRECELTHLVTAGEFGCAFERTEIAAMADAIRGLAADASRCARLGEHARVFAAQSGGLAAAVVHWQALLGATQACGTEPAVVSSKRT